MRTGVDEWEDITALTIFLERRFHFFRSNFPGMRLPWECHVQLQEINLTSLDRNCLSLMKEIGQFAKVWDLYALTHRFLLKGWRFS